MDDKRFLPEVCVAVIRTANAITRNANVLYEILATNAHKMLSS